jgi:hypothetical protein
MAARATSSSCAEDAPDTPMAPTIRPSTTIGTPPATGIIPSMASNAVRPLARRSSRAEVGVRNRAADRALDWATPIEPYGDVVHPPEGNQRP